MPDVDRNLSPAYEGFQASRQPIEVFGLALPDHKDGPTERFELFYLRSVPVNISFELRQPVIEAGLWKLPFGATVAMPKATVNENRLAISGQNDVGTTGKVFWMKAEAVAEAMQNLPDDEFRLGVLLFDGLHDPSTLLWRSSIHFNTALTRSTYRLSLS